MSRILVVDDEVKACELLKRFLQAKGHEAVTAGNGIEALDKLKDGPVDLIITDILMPEMDGFQLCRECKTSDKLRQIPFIFYTATYISKKDEGTGIPCEHLQNIFDPYFTTKETGNGLGLAVSYAIIRKHEGHISVKSETGVGTTFTMYLPVSLEQSEETISM